MFQGTYLQTLDSKGRLAIPARYKEELFDGESLCVTVTRHPDGCLVFYPNDIWEKKRQALASLPYDARHFVRYVLGSAVSLVADKSGRLLIPSDLRHLMHLERDVVIIGMGHHFELWDRAEHERIEQEAMKAGFQTLDFAF